jgi:hypothetical protein
MNKLMVKKELFEKFKGLFTVKEPGVVYIQHNVEDKPLLIPRRFFGGEGSIVIPMQVRYDDKWVCQAIMVEKVDFDDMLSYFEVYEGEFDVPMLRKVFEFPSEHLPDGDGSFRLVCHLRPDDAIAEPKLKQEGTEGGYVIEL